MASPKEDIYHDLDLSSDESPTPHSASQGGEFDLFDDLLISKNNDQVSELTTNLQKAQHDCENFKTKCEKLEDENSRLHKNIHSLWKTALSQINNKDRAIKKLETQVSALNFSRALIQVPEDEFHKGIKLIAASTCEDLEIFLKSIKSSLCICQFKKIPSLKNFDLKELIKSIRGKRINPGSSKDGKSLQTLMLKNGKSLTKRANPRYEEKIQLPKMEFSSYNLRRSNDRQNTSRFAREEKFKKKIELNLHKKKKTFQKHAGKDNISDEDINNDETDHLLKNSIFAQRKLKVINELKRKSFSNITPLQNNIDKHLPTQKISPSEPSIACQEEEKRTTSMTSNVEKIWQLSGLPNIIEREAVGLDNVQKCSINKEENGLELRENPRRSHIQPNDRHMRMNKDLLSSDKDRCKGTHMADLNEIEKSESLKNYKARETRSRDGSRESERSIENRRDSKGRHNEESRESYMEANGGSERHRENSRRSSGSRESRISTRSMKKDQHSSECSKVKSRPDRYDTHSTRPNYKSSRLRERHKSVTRSLRSYGKRDKCSSTRKSDYCEPRRHRRGTSSPKKPSDSKYLPSAFVLNGTRTPVKNKNSKTYEDVGTSLHRKGIRTPLKDKKDKKTPLKDRKGTRTPLKDQKGTRTPLKDRKGTRTPLKDEKVTLILSNKSPLTQIAEKPCPITLQANYIDHVLKQTQDLFACQQKQTYECMSGSVKNVISMSTIGINGRKEDDNFRSLQQNKNSDKTSKTFVNNQNTKAAEESSNYLDEEKEEGEITEEDEPQLLTNHISTNEKSKQCTEPTHSTSFKNEKDLSVHKSQDNRLKMTECVEKCSREDNTFDIMIRKQNDKAENVLPGSDDSEMSLFQYLTPQDKASDSDIIECPSPKLYIHNLIDKSPDKDKPDSLKINSSATSLSDCLKESLNAENPSTKQRSPSKEVSISTCSPITPATPFNKINTSSAITPCNNQEDDNLKSSTPIVAFNLEEKLRPRFAPMSSKSQTTPSNNQRRRVDFVTLKPGDPEITFSDAAFANAKEVTLPTCTQIWDNIERTYQNCSEDDSSSSCSCSSSSSSSSSSSCSTCSSSSDSDSNPTPPNTLTNHCQASSLDNFTGDLSQQTQPETVKPVVQTTSSEDAGTCSLSGKGTATSNSVPEASLHTSFTSILKEDQIGKSSCVGTSDKPNFPQKLKYYGTASLFSLSESSNSKSPVKTRQQISSNADTSSHTVTLNNCVSSSQFIGRDSPSGKSPKNKLKKISFGSNSEVIIKKLSPKCDAKQLSLNLKSPEKIPEQNCDVDSYINAQSTLNRSNNSPNTDALMADIIPKNKASETISEHPNANSPDSTSASDIQNLDSPKLNTTPTDLNVEQSCHLSKSSTDVRRSPLCSPNTNSLTKIAPSPHLDSAADQQDSNSNFTLMNTCVSSSQFNTKSPFTTLVTNSHSNVCLEGQGSSTFVFKKKRKRISAGLSSSEIFATPSCDTPANQPKKRRFTYHIPTIVNSHNGQYNNKISPTEERLTSPKSQETNVFESASPKISPHENNGATTCANPNKNVLSCSQGDDGAVQQINGEILDYISANVEPKHKKRTPVKNGVENDHAKTAKKMGTAKNNKIVANNLKKFKPNSSEQSESIKILKSNNIKKSNEVLNKKSHKKNLSSSNDAMNNPNIKNNKKKQENLKLKQKDSKPRTSLKCSAQLPTSNKSKTRNKDKSAPPLENREKKSNRSKNIKKMDKKLEILNHDDTGQDMVTKNIRNILFSLKQFEA